VINLPLNPFLFILINLFLQLLPFFLLSTEPLIVLSHCRLDSSHPFLAFLVTLTREYKSSLRVIPFILSIRPSVCYTITIKCQFSNTMKICECKKCELTLLLTMTIDLGLSEFFENLLILDIVLSL
jgi:hypothetical protein